MKKITAYLAALSDVISEVISKFLNIFCETIYIHGDLYIHIEEALGESLKSSFLNSRVFFDEDFFDKDTGERVSVIVEKSKTGQSRELFFHKNWIPIYITNDPNETHVAMTFLRGSVDMGHFLAVNYFQEKGIHTSSYLISSIFPRGDSISYESTRYYFSDPQPITDKVHGYDAEKLVEYLPYSSPLFLSDETQEVLDDIQDWLENESWYSDRGLAWKMGLMFEGMPGTGKSSFARHIAHHFKMDLYHANLKQFSNDHLVQFYANYAKGTCPKIFLFEDVDCVFDKRDGEEFGIDFNEFINKLDGVRQYPGVLTIMTTNHLEKIDPAIATRDSSGEIITRPGRIDRVITFKPMNEDQRIKFASKIAKGFEDMIPDLVDEGEGMTAADFQELCRLNVLRRYSKEKQAEKDERGAQGKESKRWF